MNEILKALIASGEVIVRHVRVDRTRTKQEAISATGRTEHCDSDVIASMPPGEGDEIDVFFFKIGDYINDWWLEPEYENLGLKPADPYSLAAVNEECPSFADEYPNATHWKNADGEYCFASFLCWDDGGRVVDVRRLADVGPGPGTIGDWDIGDWDGNQWFGGVLK